MHLMIPYASALDPACAAQLAHLRLPALEAALPWLQPAGSEGGDEYSPLLPHALRLARLRGLDATPSTALPDAAWQLQALGHEPGSAAWARLTPLHCEVGSDQVTALDPALLKLDAAESLAFFEALAWLFPDEEGWQRVHAGPGLWFVAHGSLTALPSASVERAINRNVDPWMPEARRLRTLQNELQMVLHQHPLNLAREAAGQLSLNSVWIDGCGVAQGHALPEALQLETALRQPWLTGDWQAWAQAWQDIDARCIAPLLPALREGRARLSLAGDRLCRDYEAAPRRWWHGLGLGPRPARELLQQTLEAL